jgi:hypothetical protein
MNLEYGLVLSMLLLGVPRLRAPARREPRAAGPIPRVGDGIGQRARSLAESRGRPVAGAPRGLQPAASPHRRSRR